MTTYAVTHRSRDDKWVIRSGGQRGTVIRKQDTKRPAARKARDPAMPGDTLTAYNMDGTISRRYEEPRV